MENLHKVWEAEVSSLSIGTDGAQAGEGHISSQQDGAQVLL